LYKTNNIRLTDPDFLELLDLSNNNFPMFAFTEIRTGISSPNQTKRSEDVWSNLFGQIGILFENKYDTTFVGFSENNQEFSNVKINNLRPFHNNGDAMIKNGIIFCGNINKRVILKEVITHLNTKNFIDLSRPLDVIMLDDVSSNLEYIAQSITDINDKYGFNLRFKGYHFYNVTELEKSLPPLMIIIFIYLLKMLIENILL